MAAARNLGLAATFGRPGGARFPRRGRSLTQPLQHDKTSADEPVAVVVPTYNEAENLPELFARLSSLGIPGMCLIIVDDGSPDGTAELASSLETEFAGSVEVVQRGSKQGLGTAYVEGFGRALALDAACVVQMDADLSHSPEYIPDMLAALATADVVVGSRYAKRRRCGRHLGPVPPASQLAGQPRHKAGWWAVRA